jgi:hypothetical protein
MPESNRYYRKKLTAHGFIYIADEEVEISVRNLSVTGLLAELECSQSLHDIKDIFAAIKSTSKIDLWLPKMRLVGEAEVVRADLIEGRIYLALEILHISHDVDNVLYKRKNYRKELIAPGSIIFNGQKYAFTTRNVSVTGLLAHFAEKLTVPIGTVTVFDFKQLHLRGKIKVIWLEQAEDEGTLMGLEYVQMEKSDIKGIPSFEH